jgi:hypothetical protein
VAPAVDPRIIPYGAGAANEFFDRPFEERKAALNLAQFADRQPELGLGASKVQNLINALTVRTCFPNLTLCARI